MARRSAQYEVFLDDSSFGPPVRVGALRRDLSRRDLPGRFAYDEAWLKTPGAFMLDPRLSLWRGEQHPVGPAGFGVFLDSAPDRWGRLLMERREATSARRERRPLVQLFEMDFLLGVQDETRTGALRFRQLDGPFLAQSEFAVPPVSRLAELAAVVRHIEEPRAEALPEYERWLAMLVAPGSSLGGARPKANFRDDDGTLWIAKFPARDDRYDVGAWEYVLHRLAVAAGIDVPAAGLADLGEYRTFRVKRFDRAGGRRRMYASAMTLLERQDGESGASYLDIAEFIASTGAADTIRGDLAQLFRRVVFNVLTGNRDDHLRNHGFVATPDGWRLAPAFDLNPAPAKLEHTLLLDAGSGVPRLDAIVGTAPYYRLDPGRARAIVDEVAGAVAGWRQVAAQAAGLAGSEIERMSPVFDVAY